MGISCEKLYETITFLLFKIVRGHGKVFDHVSEREMQPGDIVLVPINSDIYIPSIFKHAAVYVGNGEVIHFHGHKGKSNSGVVSKQGFHDMKKERVKCEIYRKRGGIDLDDFKRKVKDAMSSAWKYSAVTKNCIHFALWLLGLADFYTEQVVIQEKDDKKEAVRQHETLKFLLHKSIPEHGEVFSDVPEEELDRGDILLFPMENSGSLGSLFKHAAVCLGNEEVIHFQGKDNNSGQVTVEDLEAIQRERGKWQIYRKRGGINHKDFGEKVRSVMNRESRNHTDINCIHFALWLLDLSDFYNQLVEIPKEDVRGKAMNIPCQPSRQGMEGL